MALIDLSDVGLTYGGGAVGVSDVTLRVEDGEFVALLGPSGSGKTTLLRVVAGFLRPQAGSVRIGERTVVDGQTFVPPERRGLGMVFQQHAIWPHWNVGRNVDYPLRLAKVPPQERRRRVADMLALVGLPDSEKRDPATLSGGQRQRVALARALASRPQALLLDEALSALDEPLRAGLRAEIKQLADENHLTVLHVTHDRDEALALADRVVVLQDGRMAQCAPPEQIVTRPATAFIAGFMGDATLLAARRDGDAVSVDGTPLRLSERQVEVMTPGAVGEVALLPGEIDVAADDAGDGVVASALFTRDGAQLSVEWCGHQLRVRTRGSRPRRGDRVRVGIQHALFYGRP